MTEELFREDSYQRHCDATVIAVNEDGIVLDRTVFYPEGGGQPGDSGTLKLADGREIVIANTRKGGEGITHVPLDGALAPAVGDAVTAEIDWERRYLHMRIHTALHVLCAHVDGAVTGGSIGAGKGRLDFDIPGERPDKETLTQKLMEVVEANHPLTISWISDAELESNPNLVRTMSVKPPTGSGRVRMIRVGDAVDFQPCGGTHLKTTGEIGTIAVGKIENKGKQNRRINVALGD
ncbi:MAG: alanyl-tRNA editing protein [Proteobacteria bacterium]|nr:alanyl-tRNA editing protein [Pseudomonadota bacterium]MDA1310729.1 alanyl-tRNA editing protein [Pseudomonadota bacterium]